MAVIMAVMVTGMVAMVTGMVGMVTGMVGMRTGVVDTGAVMAAVGGVQASPSVSAAITDAAAMTRTTAIIPAAMAGATSRGSFSRRGRPFWIRDRTPEECPKPRLNIISFPTALSAKGRSSSERPHLRPKRRLRARNIIMTCPHCGAEHTYSPKEMAVGEIVEEKKAAEQQPDGLKFEGV